MTRPAKFRRWRNAEPANQLEYAKRELAWGLTGDEYATQIGERRTVVLADESRIDLNTDTRALGTEFNVMSLSKRVTVTVLSGKV